MQHQDFNSLYWNEIVKNLKSHPRNKTVSEYHRKEYLDLFEKWKINFNGKKVLITDLFNEAFERYELLFQMKKEYLLIGIDISKLVIKKFIRRTKVLDLKNARCIICDVRNLPFKKNAFDLIISPSTLDHFPKGDFITSLKELKESLHPTGRIVVTLQNKQNAFLYFQVMSFFGEMPFIMKTYSMNEASKTMEHCGFEIKEKLSITHILFPWLFLFFLNTRFAKSNLGNKFIKKNLILFKKIGNNITKKYTAKFIAIKAEKKNL